MSRAILLIVGTLMLLGACTQRMICPAYQSSYIYDKESLRKKFSYFKEDSTPKILTASKSKYLIAVPESYRKKMRNLQTVEMKPVYPEIPDSLKMDDGADLSLAERDEPDSASVAGQQGLQPGDSAYAITKTKEKFNIDQDNYMWYFRDVLVLPDVRAALEDKKEEKNKPADKAAKKGPFNFFKNLFKKKSKDSTSVSSPAVPIDSDSTATKGKKKINLFKKKKATSKDKASDKKDDGKKEEDDDGFGS